MGSTSGIPFYDVAVKKGAERRLRVERRPDPAHGDGRRRVLNIYGASVSIVKSTPEKQLAAWLFLRWMSESAQQAEWVRRLELLPGTEVHRRRARRLLWPPIPSSPRRGRRLQTSDQKAEPSFLGYEQVRDAISSAYNAVLDGAELDSTLAALDAKANRIYRQAKP